MRKALQWTTQEDQLILSNISLIKSKRWKNISNILKEKGFYKKQAQCRERYINFLSLSVDKSENVSISDLELFYQKYEELGPRWTQIQQFLPKKSQVELKNIFYGNIRCIIKKIFKFFTSKTAVFVNKFNTFTLQNIYSGKKDYRGLNIVKEDIKNMNYRFDEKACLSLMQNKKDEYKKLFIVLLDEDLTKKSKHYDWFKKVQEKYLQNEQTFIKTSKDQEEPTEPKFPDLYPNKNINMSQQNHQQSRNQEQKKQQNNLRLQIEHSQNIYRNWKENQSQYFNINYVHYHQIQRENFLFYPGQQIYFKPYQQTVGILNPYQTYKNPYFYCNSWN